MQPAIEERKTGRRGRRPLRSKALPRGAWERQRLLSPSTGACHSTPPVRHVGAAAGIGAETIRCGTFLQRGCNQAKGNPKTVGFWRRFCILLPPWVKGCRAGARNIPAGGKHAGRGCSPQSKNEKRAVGDAGPYGGIDESAPVFKGAPMRAVEDAGPCGVRERGTKKRPASGSRNAFFTSYHKSAKDCNAGSAFPAAGHCIWTHGE